MSRHITNKLHRNIETIMQILKPSRQKRVHPADMRIKDYNSGVREGLRVAIETICQNQNWDKKMLTENLHEYRKIISK